MNKQKKCAKCGAAFECSHDENCWCMEFKISKENLEKLRKSFDNCLCPNCLKQFADK